MSVPDWMIETPSPSVDDMAAVIRQLVRSLRKASPGNEVAERALDYLKRHGLQGSPLRTASAPAVPAAGEQARPRVTFMEQAQDMASFPFYAAGADEGKDAQDAARLDWLGEQFVTVRIPLRYGSRECFMGSPDDNDGEPVPWNIRAKIDAARAGGETS